MLDYLYIRQFPGCNDGGVLFGLTTPIHSMIVRCVDRPQSLQRNTHPDVDKFASVSTVLLDIFVSNQHVYSRIQGVLL
jgi:hypothetical protein